MLAVLLVVFSSVKASEVLRHPDGEDVPVTIRNKAMPQMDGSRIGTILERYYSDGLGGAESWAKVESLRVMGTLTLESGVFELQAYQKKLNLIKITITAEGHGALLLAYDGVTAWQQPPGAEEPILMTEAEARRFVHSARFGNYLLFPFEEGKVIEFVNTVPIEGALCHHIRVRLDTDYQVDYYIDIRSYVEVKVVNTDLRSGSVNSVVFDEYIWDYGMPIAKKVESFENGEWVSSLELNEVRINTGLMPWMFQMSK